jgi:hypothetical protein
MIVMCVTNRLNTTGSFTEADVLHSRRRRRNGSRYSPKTRLCGVDRVGRHGDLLLHLLFVPCDSNHRIACGTTPASSHFSSESEASEADENDGKKKEKKAPDEQDEFNPDEAELIESDGKCEIESK